MRQRVRHKCCTRGRSRPAHPRQLAEVLMPERSARRFLCARCRGPVLVCSHCDRGQIYCASGCAAAARGERQRDAARRYQHSRRGRFKHAARTQRWRARQAVATRLATTTPAQLVTHQGCPLAASTAVLEAVPSPMPGVAGPATQPCKILIVSSTSTPATPGSGDPVLTPTTSPTLTPTIAAPVWRCPWCHTPCAPRVRLGFLRHSRPPRIASRRGEPTHGHSP
jgi:hypothetical protein